MAAVAVPTRVLRSRKRPAIPPPMEAVRETPKRGARQLTERRMAKIRIYMKDAYYNPKILGEYATSRWIKGLIDGLEERQKNAVIRADVELWLKKYPLFFKNELRRIQRYDNRQMDTSSSSSRRSSGSESDKEGDTERDSGLEETATGESATSTQSDSQSLIPKKKQKTGPGPSGKQIREMAPIKSKNLAAKLDINDCQSTQTDLKTLVIPIDPLMTAETLSTLTDSFPGPLLSVSGDGLIRLLGCFDVIAFSNLIAQLQEMGSFPSFPAQSVQLTIQSEPSSDGEIGEIGNMDLLHSFREGTNKLMKTAERFVSGETSDAGNGINWESCIYALKLLNFTLNVRHQE